VTTVAQYVVCESQPTSLPSDMFILGTKLLTPLTRATRNPLIYPGNCQLRLQCSSQLLTLASDPQMFSHFPRPRAADIVGIGSLSLISNTSPHARNDVLSQGLGGLPRKKNQVSYPKRLPALFTLSGRTRLSTFPGSAPALSLGFHELAAHPASNTWLSCPILTT
jgi:hypothetical protein